MKVILDCNVVISACLNPGNCRKVLESVVRFHDCVLSVEILQEYLTVSKRDKFAAARLQLTQSIFLLSSNACFITPQPYGVLLPDPKDQMYLDAAVSGAVDVLVTGNIKHFPMREYQGISVLSPKQFLELMPNH